MLRQESTYNCNCGTVFANSLECEVHVQSCQSINDIVRAKLLNELNPGVGPINTAVFQADQPLTVVKDEVAAPEPKKSPYVFTQAGEQLIEELMRMAPIAGKREALAAQLDGPSGMGKSVIVREVALRLLREFMAINAHPGMDLGLLVGSMYPRPTEQGMTLVWEDGDLTRAIKNGIIFFFEEATRAPQEMVSRLFGLLDQGFGYFNLPEAGIVNVPIHELFWMILTSNPAGAGYQTSRLDLAFQSRMCSVLEVNEPMADERAILTNILAPTNSEVGHNLVDRFLHFAIDTRRPDSNGVDHGVNTRDLIYAATLQSRGFEATRAIEISIANKYPASKPVIMHHSSEHFMTNHDYAAEAEALAQELTEYQSGVSAQVPGGA
jgi:nitric oxide reductase NorQ protein